jgi:3-oxoacyl-[acyl-carrier protein] reductase
VDLGLSGRRAVVLAGTRGLGAAAATALHAEGCEVVTCGRTAAPPGPGIRTVAADLTRPGEVGRFLDVALDLLGGVDVLVTNCGGPRPGPTGELIEDDWAAAFDAILLSVVHACRRVVPLLAAQGRGSVICVTSTSVLQPIAGLALSNALRPAVAGFARTLAAEVAGSGVRINCVLPGPFATGRSLEVSAAAARTAGGDPAAELDRRAGSIPAGRLGDPAEFGRLVAFLASDACSYLTGTTVVIDGGSSLRAG